MDSCRNCGYVYGPYPLGIHKILEDGTCSSCKGVAILPPAFESGWRGLKPTNMRTDTDCMRCCVSMVLGLPYAKVPDFVGDEVRRRNSSNYGPGSWITEMARWAKGRGISMVRVGCTGDGEMLCSISEGGLWIASGPTGRGRNHAVAYRGDLMVHDPHPSKNGLLSITAATIFTV